MGNTGYGRIWHKGRFELAHRASYLVFNGDIGNSFVLHRCDVKCCINPLHLFLGSQSDNLKDCVAKGRYKSNMKRLNDSHIELALSKRQSGETYEKIGKELGVTAQAIFWRLRHLAH